LVAKDIRHLQSPDLQVKDWLQQKVSQGEEDAFSLMDCRLV